MLPLTPAVFHILLALADGEKHGYAIMQEVAAITNGEMKKMNPRHALWINQTDVGDGLGGRE